MATTNALQWNPTAANQENDAAYLADSQRAGGAVNPELFDAALANKLFYQLSTYMTGLFAAFAAKGFTTSDSNLSTLTAQCANFLTTADVLPAVAITAYAASVALNAAAANGFYITAMTGNLTITAVTGLSSGQIIAMYYQQDATGGRTVTFPSVMVGAAQPDPAANTVSLQLFGYDNTTSKLRAFTPLLSDTGAWFPDTLAVAGNLTAPTQVSTDNSTKVATTAWAKFGFGVSLTTNGYLRLPSWLGGVTLQWGYQAITNNTFNFPTAFSSACFALFASRDGTSLGAYSDVPYMRQVSLSQFFLATQNSQNGSTGNFPCWWLAIGN